MAIALCPACGKLVCLEFPLHDCKKKKAKKKPALAYSERDKASKAKP